MHPAGVAANVNNKPKVHPVNSALLNSVRHRDPRLQRQQQQQQQQQMQQNQNGERSNQQNVRSAHNDKDKHDRNHKSSHKSPTRVSSSSSNNRSSGSRSGKNSQRDKERERDRKRSESKSSTTSSSSAGSTSASSDRKKLYSGSTKSDKHSSKCDKDAFEIAPLSSAFKRKSTSPASSPTKSRDSKRSNNHKSHNSSRSKTRSRSRSPGESKVDKSYGDVDLRRTSTSSTSSSMIISPEKRPKITDSDQETANSKEELSKPLLVNTPTNTNTKEIDKSKTCLLLYIINITKQSLCILSLNEYYLHQNTLKQPQRVFFLCW